MPKVKTLLVRFIRIARNALMDLRYGGFLTGKIKTRFKHLGAVNTENSDYAALEFIFEGRVKHSDVLVDIGCGKGRVINYWLSRGWRNRMIGLELDPEIADKTRRRLHRHENVTIIACNAIENIPPDGTLFYLYNPFDAPVLEEFKNRLVSELAERTDITILYYNCRHVDVFDNDPRWTVEITDVGDSSAAPFDRLAIIKMKC